MHLEDLILVDYIFDEEEIKFLQKICDDPKWTRINDFINVENNKDGNRYVKNVVKHIDDICPKKIIKSYAEHISYYESNSVIDKIKNGFTPDSKITKYVEGDDYSWHDDAYKKLEDNVIWTRQISSITYLNDNYLGGETEFSCGLVVKPETGKTVIFPSNWCFPHRGKVVTKGIKYIYVLHIWS